MTSSDIRQRAEQLVETEAETTREEERESRIRDAIERIKEQDREAAAAQARREARARVAKLGHRRYELEQRMEELARELASSIAELEVLDTEQRNELRDAGIKAPLIGAPVLLTEWVQARLSRLYSPTGGRDMHVPQVYAALQNRSLAAVDPLASPRTRQDDQGAA
jgi:uncharacterized protein YhaN